MSTKERSEAPESSEQTAPSYHDLHITTAEIERTSIFDLSYGYEVTCTRVGGWCLWLWDKDEESHVKVAGEFDSVGLRLDVGGHVICDSLTKPVEMDV